MPKFLLNTCCGCIELRTGCLIIGYLNLIADIVMIILGIIMLVGLSVVANDSDPKTQQIGTVGVAMAIILLIVMIILLGFILALLVGVHKNKRGHVKAYLIFSTICIVIYVLSFFMSFGGQIAAGEIARQLLNILFSIYFLLVIRSYYYKMDTTVPTYNSA